MSTATEIQTLLRFLSQDAKIPLPMAMGKIKDLQKSSLISPALLAKSNLQAIQAFFPEEKLAKQILNAAKRVTKKRTSSDAQSESPVKRKKAVLGDEPLTPAALEESLALPQVTLDEQDLEHIVLHTNRAPLVLAFATTLLKYSMPGQPLSSRLSLAQAVVSANSRSKAVSLGIEKGNSAEEDGWGQGQPKFRIMGRDIRVMKRWGHDWKADTTMGDVTTKKEGLDGVKIEPTRIEDEGDVKQENPSDSEPALWGLDLEALRSSNGPLMSGAQGMNSSGLPIYTAQSARAYLFKSFTSLSTTTEASPKKKSVAVVNAEKERSLGILLNALDLLFSSWAHVLSKEELDRRAWAWYVAVRPEVQNGVAGWGGKGEVKLSDILGLRRKG
ncbi:hypothetical protein MMC12_002650 [Toensbergia leucococca]|nr:hypothetical protein [Toensbergia leucococca]